MNTTPQHIMATEEEMLAAGPRNNAEEEEEVDICITFPSPTTAIAKEMHKVVMTEQRTNTTQLLCFSTMQIRTCRN